MQITLHVVEDETNTVVHTVLDLRGYVAALHESGYAKATIARRLASMRSFFRFGQREGWIDTNPAKPLRNPRKGRALPHFLSAEDLGRLLKAPPPNEPAGLRDRALIGAMVYSFARVSAVVGMNVEDYFPKNTRYWFRLHEKGGKYHEVPGHHNAQEYLYDYITAAGIGNDKKTPLFRSIDNRRQITSRRVHRTARRTRCRYGVALQSDPVRHRPRRLRGTRSRGPALVPVRTPRSRA